MTVHIEAIDTTTPAGRLLFGIGSSRAAFEHDLIRERANAGLSSTYVTIEKHVSIR